MSSLGSQNPVTQCAVQKPSAGRKHSLAAKRSATPSKPGHISRPPNSFFLFRKDYVKNHYPLPEGMKNTELSKMLGSIWRSLPQAEKLPWEELAGRLKEEHSKKHPGYKYSPNRKQGNQRQGKKTKGLDNSPNVVTVQETRNLTLPPPLSPDTSFPRELLHQGGSFSPSNWEDHVWVPTPESPHTLPQHHGQLYYEPLSQKSPSVPIPDGSTTHNSMVQNTVQTNVLPLVPPSPSYGHHHLHSGNMLGFIPMHSSPSAAPPQPSQYDTLESSVQLPLNQGEYFSRLLEGQQIIYDSNSNRGSSPPSPSRQRFQSSLYDPSIPPERQDAAVTGLRSGCDSYGPDSLSWNISVTTVPPDSHITNIPLMREAGFNLTPPLATREPESGSFQVQSANISRGQPEHLRNDVFGSIQSQHLRHVPAFGTNFSRYFKSSSTLQESFLTDSHPQQDPPQGFEEILFPSLKDTDGLAHLPPEASSSSPLYMDYNSPVEFKFLDGFTPSGSLSSRGSTQGSPPHLGPFGWDAEYLEK